jgi:hypothetical protein
MCTYTYIWPVHGPVFCIKQDTCWQVKIAREWRRVWLIIINLHIAMGEGMWNGPSDLDTKVLGYHLPTFHEQNVQAHTFKFSDHLHLCIITSVKMKWSRDHVLTCSYIHETSTVVLDRLKVISSGSVYMKICKNMFPRGPSGGNIWSPIGSKFGRNVDYLLTR